MRKSFSLSYLAVSAIPLRCLLAVMIGLPAVANALVYEIRGEGGGTGSEVGGKTESNTPYFGPLAPGDGYTDKAVGFMWRHQGEWRRLDTLRTDAALATEILLEGPVDAAYLATTIDDGDARGVLVSDWDWSACCAGAAQSSDTTGGVEVEVAISSYSGIGHWYLMTGDVIRPQAMSFQTEVALRDGSADVPLPGVPALLAIGAAMLVWSRRRGRLG